MSTAALQVTESSVLRLDELEVEPVAALLADYGLQLARVACGQAIPGSYWGEPEAGVIGNVVYARGDTPVHSLLHEACHLIVLPDDRRARVHTDASDSIEEEDATCYLQILLADALSGMGRARMCADMDAWGYSFRLGSARAWFEHDATEAADFLRNRGLPHESAGANRHNSPSFPEDGHSCHPSSRVQLQSPA